MTNKELLLELETYKKMVSTIAKDYEIEDCLMSDYYFQTKHDIKNKVFLTQNQKDRLADKITSLSILLCRNYEWIEFRNKPVEHVRLGRTTEYYDNDYLLSGKPTKEDMYDTITGHFVSFETEVFEDNKRYLIKDLLGD